MNFFLSRDWNRVRTRVKRYWNAGWRPIGRPLEDLSEAVRNFRSGYRLRLQRSQSNQVVGGAHVSEPPTNFLAASQLHFPQHPRLGRQRALHPTIGCGRLISIVERMQRTSRMLSNRQSPQYYSDADFSAPQAYCCDRCESQDRPPGLSRSGTGITAYPSDIFGQRPSRAW